MCRSRTPSFLRLNPHLPIGYTLEHVLEWQSIARCAISIEASGQSHTSQSLQDRVLLLGWWQMAAQAALHLPTCSLEHLQQSDAGEPANVSAIQQTRVLVAELTGGEPPLHTPVLGIWH